MRSKPHARFLRALADSLMRIAISPDALVLVALSGGPDSVALLHAMLALRQRLGFRVAAAHLNHRIRGSESDRDETFVRDLCARLSVELTCRRADGLSSRTPNLEERAREARYAFLNAAAARSGADYIALAHHADDQAETVMMRLLRGSGAAGLAAMAERGPGRIVRPMIHVTRTEVLAYLDCIGEKFVIDSSNQSAAPARNRIRNHLLPMLEREYAPGLSGRLAELASEMRALDDFVNAAARRELERLLSGDGLNIAGFGQSHPAIQAEMVRQFILDEIGTLRRIERVHIEAVRRLCLEGPPNGSLDIPGLTIRREYGLLKVTYSRKHAAPFVVRLCKGRTEIPEAGILFDSAIVSPLRVGAPRNKFEALFDANEAGDGLMVRSPRAGDRIAPLGMTGHRKVKDVFIDNKLSAWNRSRFPIVELKGAIAWLPGILRGRVGLVTEASENILRVTTLPMV